MLSNVPGSRCRCGLTHMLCAHVFSADISTYTHTQTHSRQIHCPLKLACLSSSCFSTHPHCCHSGQEAVGEIRLTKSLFIKLAKSICSAFGVCVCVCFREEKRKSKHYWNGGGDLSQGLKAYPRSTLGSSLDIAIWNHESRTEDEENAK